MSHTHDDGSLASAIVGCLSTLFFGKIFGLLSLADVTVALILGAAGAIGGYFAKKLIEKIVLKFKPKNNQVK
jgi:uncharacterized membrane protein